MIENNLINIYGKTILITGASSGIGRETAIQLSRQGCNLVLTGRDEKKLQETLSLLDRECVVYCSAVDLNDDASMQTFVGGIPNKLDGVVFCAGIAEYAPIRALTKTRAQRIMDTNFFSQVSLTNMLIGQKKLNRGGSLVYISSLAAKQGVAATGAYAASKAALSSFAKVAASELSSSGIRVNILCPGIVKTPMGDMVSGLAGEIEKDYPLGIGMPIDVAGACVFFLSNASRWITGCELIMDGGLTLK